MTESKKSQLDKFKEAARELETDDDEERFNERLKKLAKPRADGKGIVNPSDGKVPSSRGGKDE